MKISAQQVSIKYYVLRIKYFVSKLSAINHQPLAINRGFTLIEVLVAATILVTLLGGVILTLNPLGQLNKGQDAQRISDLNQVKNAIDLYYNDKKCYPQQIPFGNEWRVNNTVYMKKVPQDPKCNGGSGTCYKYRTDSSAFCPQWNVVFAPVSKSSSLTNLCPLSSLSNCTPTGYSNATWACTLSGAVNCDALAAASSIGGGGIETINPTATPTPLPSSTPTPTPTPPAGSVTYDFGNPASTNPDIYEATIMPFYQPIGSVQSIRVLADDTVGNITSIKAILYSDGDAREFTLSRTGGTAQSGTWTGTWQVTDTYNRTYGYDLIGTDSLGNKSTSSIRANR